MDYDQMKKDLQSKNQPHLYQLAIKDKTLTSMNSSQQNNKTSSFNDFPKYPYELLVKSVDELPQDVIAESKEVIIVFKPFKKKFFFNHF